VNPADRPTAMGIDPGLDGGLAVRLPDGSVRLQPSPFLPAGAGTKQNDAATIASCARGYSDVSLLMALDHIASPSIRRGRVRSPPLWPGARPGGPVRPLFQIRSKLPLEEKPCPPTGIRHR
jgi:hypothetical protein